MFQQENDLFQLGNWLSSWGFTCMQLAAHHDMTHGFMYAMNAEWVQHDK